MKWFKIYPQKWLLGSTRFEISLEQRAIFIDFLSMASLNDPPGEFPYFSLDQLGHQCCCAREIVEKAIERLIQTEKIVHFPKKKRIIIKNWAKYQSEYERQKPYRSQEKASNKVTTPDITKLPLEGEGEEEEKEKRNRNREEEKKREIQEGETSPGKIQFISILKEFSLSFPYPFSQEEDGVLFDSFARKIDVITELHKKLEFWKQNPKALGSKKKSARLQLYEFFIDEVDFQREKAENASHNK
jgi:hypothetical protein